MTGSQLRQARQQLFSNHHPPATAPLLNSLPMLLPIIPCMTVIKLLVFTCGCGRKVQVIISATLAELEAKRSSEQEIIDHVIAIVCWETKPMPYSSKTWYLLAGSAFRIQVPLELWISWVNNWRPGARIFIPNIVQNDSLKLQYRGKLVSLHAMYV